MSQPGRGQWNLYCKLFLCWTWKPPEEGLSLAGKHRRFCAVVAKNLIYMCPMHYHDLSWLKCWIFLMNVSTLCLIIYLSKAAVLQLQLAVLCNTVTWDESTYLFFCFTSTEAYWNVGPTFTITYLLAECALWWAGSGAHPLQHWRLPHWSCRWCSL